MDRFQSLQGSQTIKNKNDEEQMNKTINELNSPTKKTHTKHCNNLQYDIKY